MINNPTSCLLYLKLHQQISIASMRSDNEMASGQATILSRCCRP